jgi:hypothetical protein
VTRSYSFGNGISIRELSPIRWDVAIIKSDVSELRLPAVIRLLRQAALDHMGQFVRELF